MSEELTSTDALSLRRLLGGVAGGAIGASLGMSGDRAHGMLASRASPMTFVVFGSNWRCRLTWKAARAASRVPSTCGPLQSQCSVSDDRDHG
jgi:hypothetical protein